ncbi:hypothetical protein CK203_039981 [Vitis vinifera]|uniref:Uncharacterized protein n=1 Tax=Vitis vinifera TaxID=29760 RepID=A0A438I2Y9_VITVI|nr:hypothetical protein CK203_039981 [Vitis vinifera]
MFSNSQLHALIFFLAGMLSTHFLAIGKFWKMKWNSMLSTKLGFALIFHVGLSLHWVILCKGLLVTTIIIIINIILVRHRCASIWVIETKSISDIRKLVTYWVLISLIKLFEDAFANLLEW